MPVCGLDGSQSTSFWHLSECGSSGRSSCRSLMLLEINSQCSSATEAQSILCLYQAGPDPNHTQSPENGTEILQMLELEARCEANAASPQKRSKQQKEDDGVAGSAGSAVCGSRFRALEAVKESESRNPGLV